MAEGASIGCPETNFASRRLPSAAITIRIMHLPVMRTDRASGGYSGLTFLTKSFLISFLEISIGDGCEAGWPDLVSGVWGETSCATTLTPAQRRPKVIAVLKIWFFILAPAFPKQPCP